MRHDVGDGLTVNGEDYPLAGSHRVNDLTRAISQITNANLHVRQRSTMLSASLGTPVVPRQEVPSLNA
jgi:hypothetical protein